MKRCAFVIGKGIMAGAGASTIGAIFFPFNNPEERPKAELELVVHKPHEHKWDWNWDNRQNQCVMKNENTVCPLHHIIFVRHGQGCAKTPDTITGKGVTQSKLTAEYLKKHDIVFDRFISSSDEMAFETAQILGEVLGIKPEKSDDFKEKEPTLPCPNIGPTRSVTDQIQFHVSMNF